LVTPGIKMPNLANNPDQQRSGDAKTALADGADYVVVGRALTSAQDPVAALDALLA
jgi:orotidine-5'-phosphate decarboxylase